MMLLLKRGKNMLKQLHFLNMGTELTHLDAIKYFDALSEKYYDVIFGEIIYDDDEFGLEEYQNTLYNALTTAPVFRMYSMSGLEVDGVHTYENNGVQISYSLCYLRKKVTSLIVVIKNKKYERKLNENR